MSMDACIGYIVLPLINYNNNNNKLIIKLNYNRMQLLGEGRTRRTKTMMNYCDLDCSLWLSVWTEVTWCSTCNDTDGYLKSTQDSTQQRLSLLSTSFTKGYVHSLYAFNCCCVLILQLRGCKQCNAFFSVCTDAYKLEKCLSIEVAERAWRKKKGGKKRKEKKNETEKKRSEKKKFQCGNRTRDLLICKH